MNRVRHEQVIACKRNSVKRRTRLHCYLFPKEAGVIFAAHRIVGNFGVVGRAQWPMLTMPDIVRAQANRRRGWR
jgi:hypothetical protein